MIRLPSTSRQITSAPATRRSRLGVAAWGLAALVALVAAAPALAGPSAGAFLVFDARTGEIVAKKNADQAWYPASVTKLMTTWVTLQAIRAGRITPATMVPMTAQASRQPPSKMGFKIGESVTVDNALKIIMVKSANDVAWALGEAVGGSKEAFVSEMNRQARMLGMTSTHWSNPNGLPDGMQVSTARDLGLLARALLREFPEAEELWHLPGIQYGNDIIRNHNHLIDHYPGADGMKTGFICSSGFNVVASATRGTRRLVAVVLGARSARQRAELAAELFTNGFENADGGLFGRFTAPETLDHMARGAEAGNPVRDVKQEICGKKRNEAPDPEEYGTESGPRADRDPGAIVRPGTSEAQVRRVSYLTQRFDAGPPVRVWLGPAEAAPPDAGGMLAMAADPAIARIPIFAGGAAAAVALPASLAARPNVPQPATGPGAGAGLGATLTPADGKPLSLGGPAGSTPAKKVAARPPEPSVKAKPSPAAAKPMPVKPAHPAKVEPKKPEPHKAAKAEPKPPEKPAPKKAPATPPKKPKTDD